LFKKYWFIGVVAVVLIGFIGFYAADSYKNREITVDSKQVDGKYVVYSLDDEDVLADDFYNTLYDSYGLNISFLSYERAVLKSAYETTEDMSTFAANYAANILSRYSASDIEKSLKSAGYSNGVDDLQEYYINLQKRDLAVKDFVLANSDKYLKDLKGTNGRLIYHILVKTDVEEVTDEEGNVTEYKAKPTEDQTSKLNTILDALKDEANTFEQVAYQYSEDSSNAQGGYIGLINEENMGNYDKFFAKAAMELKDGEVSEVITSQFGYHILYNAGSSDEALLDDYYFLSNLESQYQSLIIESIMTKADENGFEIVDEDLKAQLKAQMGGEE
ncbi:MAG: peptidylprolyl isomerase, partial [Erysipelotrichaceae bacterium]|nr:peptidylprolyl isomerase [Erysipelotrichaceae bacterium]